MPVAPSGWPLVETARGVDRDPAADGEFAALGRRAAATRGDEAEVLGLDDLAHRRGVVDFGDVDVAGPDAGDLVGLQRRQAADAPFRLVDAPVAETADHAGRDLDRAAAVGADPLQPLLGADDGGGGTSDNGAHIGSVIG